MTPVELQELFNEAASTDNAALALEGVKEWAKKQLWFSDRSFRLDLPTGQEKLIYAQKPGLCQICRVHFPAGTDVMWRTNCSSHVECWEKMFNKKVFANANSL